MKTRHQLYYEKVKLDPARYEARLKRIREGAERQRAKEKSDPQLWYARLEKQRKRRADPIYREEMNKVERERQRTLPDGVIAGHLGLKVADCPKELIELKRTHMLLSRALGTQVKSI
jgi:hypothetical protein